MKKYLIPISLLIAFAVATSVKIASAALTPDSSAAQSSSITDVLSSPTDGTNMLWRYLDRMTAIQHLNYSSVHDWELRRAEVRHRLLLAYGLDPMPERVPLDVRYGGSLDRGDYILKRVYWQSYPQIYASGWLYMPKTPGKHPGILNPHGHWEMGASHEIVQIRCIALAKKGYVALAVDSVHNSTDYCYEYGFFPSLGTQTWDNIRGLDLLVSLPEVDANRIGCSGGSGGGTQTMLMMALDDRIKVAVPAVGCASYRRVLGPGNESWSGCCLYGWNLAPFTDHREFLSMFAPKPALILTVSGDDWEADFPNDEFLDIQSIYNLYGAGDRAVCKQWAINHYYSKPMREAAYAWFNKYLKGINDPEAAMEPDIKIESIETLKSLNLPGEPWGERCNSMYFRIADSKPMSAVADDYKQRFRFVPPHPKNKAEWNSYLSSLRTNVTRLLNDVPVKGQEVWVPHTVKIADMPVEKMRIRSEPEIDVPVLLFRPQGEGRHPAIILLHPDGKKVVVEKHIDLIKKLNSQGIAVLLPDVRIMGELMVDTTVLQPTFHYPMGPGTFATGTILWGRPYTGMQLTDVRACIDVLSSRHDIDPARLALMGIDGIGANTLFIGALEPRFAAVAVDAAGTIPQIFDILRYGDLPQAAALTAPRRLFIGEADSSFDFTRSAYSGLGAGSRLTLQARKADPMAVADALIQALNRQETRSL